MALLNLDYWKAKRTPTLLQTELAECGLVCVAMVAAHHGRRETMAALRGWFASSRGATLRTILAASSMLGLRTRALKVEIDGLTELPLPAILHWELSHFVVLDKVSGARFTILDPSLGKRVLTRDEVSQGFTGVCVEMSPGPGFVPDAGERASDALPLLGKIDALKSNLAVAVLLGLATQIASLSVPYYWQWMLDQALPSGDRALVGTLALAFTCLLVFQVSMNSVRSWLITSVSTKARFQWFGNVASHVIQLPLDYFSRRSLGDIASRFSSIEQIQHVLTSRFLESIMDGALALVVFLVMLVYSPPLALIAATALGIYALARFATQDRIESATKSALMHSAKQGSHLLETIRGMQTVRLFGRGADRSARWMNLLAAQVNEETQVARLQLLSTGANTLLFGLERIAVIALGIYLVLDSKLSIGMLVAFIGYKEQFTDSSSRLTDAFFELRLLRVQSERLRDITGTAAEPQDEPTPLDIGTPVLALENVTFHHASDQPAAISNISLTLDYGESVCITGPSGCGKSTLARVILGLHVPQQGRVKVNGLEAGEIGFQRYRRLFGAVMQDDVLFAGTIEQNIHFFDAEPDIAWAHECARMAGIESEILQMPMKYRTLIGDLGTGLSGGQKQRIFLARALYTRPQILVLDEATSHLDVENERLVNLAIERASITRIIIAHRPETIAMADRVVRMDGGRVVLDQAVDVGHPPLELVHGLAGSPAA